MTDIVDPALEHYASEHTTAPPEFLEALATELRAELEFPGMMVGRLEGRYLELLTFALGAGSVLEIGTFGGYSALSMAAGLAPGGRITTCEISPVHAAFARRHIAASPYAGRIEVVVGPAMDTIATLEGPFDLVFIDADKANIPAYFSFALDLTRRGGVILVDNVVRNGAVIDAASADPDVQGVRQFNERIAREARVSATAIQTVGSKGYDGFAIALVTGGA